MTDPAAPDLIALRAAADGVAILGRCLDVGADLERWRATAELISGDVAADGLDQALGLLEELRDGRAAELVELVSQLLRSLPPPME
jgi:hypothetical protein